MDQRQREDVLKDLKAHFEKLGQSLKPGQTLKIDITDVDLAGREEPRMRGMNDLRVLNGRADWPRISLHYVLEQDGKVLSQGDAQLSDMSYMSRINRYPSDARLRYEKQMIDDWFAKTFGVPAKARRANKDDEPAPPRVSWTSAGSRHARGRPQALYCAPEIFSQAIFIPGAAVNGIAAVACRCNFLKGMHMLISKAMKTWVAVLALAASSGAWPGCRSISATPTIIRTCRSARATASRSWRAWRSISRCWARACGPGRT
jgi:hypothetical protein